MIIKPEMYIFGLSHAVSTRCKNHGWFHDTDSSKCNYFKFNMNYTDFRQHIHIDVTNHDANLLKISKYYSYEETKIFDQLSDENFLFIQIGN